MKSRALLQIVWVSGGFWTQRPRDIRNTESKKKAADFVSSLTSKLSSARLSWLAIVRLLVVFGPSTELHFLNGNVGRLCD